MNARTRRTWKRPALLGACCSGAAAALLWLLTAVPGAVVPSFAEVRAAWRPSEAWLLDRHGEVLQSVRVDLDGRRLAWTPLDAISKAMITAAIGGEDRRFYRHHGIDWRAIAGALRDAAGGRAERGASTISMQLAGLLDASLRPDGARRSVAQKLAQMRAARALEARWSKRQILEAYLNLAGYRGELQGITAAARALFDKAPAGLTADQASLLAALLPAPAAPPAAVAARACRLRAAALPGSDCSRLQRLAASALSGRLAPALEVDLAPHLARRLLDESGANVTTTLEADVQRRVRDILADRLRGLTGRNVRDAAALVVDTRSGAVRAWVGSAGPASRAPRVDGVRARRQAGSTLKPALYGLALERRYLTAASILEDAPLSRDTHSGLYAPQNYDQDFKGYVSVRSALAASLNVPAVRTLELVGVEAFRNRLRALGYAGITREADYYGYSLALGSAEVSLAEQVAAYRTLARGGRYTALSVIAQTSGAPERRVIPAEVAFIVADILADRGARAATFGLDSPLTTRYWSAVKTGTSKDMRDNWCIGFSAEYTVGVWVGNFEGDAMHDVSGITGAAPMWLEIMNALHAGPAAPPPQPPAGLVHRDIRFRPAVEAPRGEWFLPGTEASSIELDPPGRGPARITRPANGVIIALDPDIPQPRQRLSFAVRGDTGGQRLVLDGVDLGAARRTHRWFPVPGAHRLELVDAAGRVHDAVYFTVRGLH